MGQLATDCSHHKVSENQVVNMIQKVGLTRSVRRDRDYNDVLLDHLSVFRTIVVMHKPEG